MLLKENLSPSPLRAKNGKSDSYIQINNKKAKNRNKKIKSDEFTGSHRGKSNNAKNLIAPKLFCILSAPVLFLPTQYLTNLSIKNNNKFDQKKVNFSGASCLSGECLFYVRFMVAGIIFVAIKKRENN